MSDEQTAVVFKQYPFVPGEKIYIMDGRRRGDWQVLEVTDTKVTLRCPVSGREFVWDRFCYQLQADERR